MGALRSRNPLLIVERRDAPDRHARSRELLVLAIEPRILEAAGMV